MLQVLLLFVLPIISINIMGSLIHGSKDSFNFFTIRTECLLVRRSEEYILWSIWRAGRIPEAGSLRQREK